MTENTEFEEIEESGENQYVTRDELEGLLDSKFESFIDRFTSDTLEGDDGWVVDRLPL